MYVVKVRIAKSKIDGKGVFAIEKIPKGKIVWLYDPLQDLSVTQEEFTKLDKVEKARFYHSAYLSPWSGLWICPPPDEAANYTNHSLQNNTTVKYDASISSEPYFIANHNIKIGEEITNNYYEFDEITKQTKPDWAENGG